MKKIIVLLVALLTLSLITVPVLAEDVNSGLSLDVTVTITDNEDGTFTVVIPNDPNYATLTPKMVVYDTGLTEASVLNATTSTYLPSEDVSVDADGNVSFVVREGGTYIVSNLISATVVSAPTANENLVYNGNPQALVTAGEGLNGTMVYCLTKDGTYSDTIPTATDAGNYTVYYYVKGSGANDSSVASVNVTIYKKTFDGTIDSPTVSSPITYGESVSKAGLTGEGWTFANPNLVPESAGTFEATVIYALSDADNVNYSRVVGYNGANKMIIRTVSITVKKADPASVTFPELTATYGDTLASITLPEGFSFVETDLTKTVGNASETAVEIPMVYTPKDTDNYNTVTGNGLLTVNKATYTGTVTVPKLDPVESGTKLSDVKLPAGYTWKDATKEVGETNTAIYSPGANYNDVEIEIPVKVVSTESGVNSSEVESVAGVNVTDNTPLVDSVASVINGDDSVVKTTMKEETKAAVAEAVKNASTVETYIEVQVSDVEIKETEMTAIEEKAGTDGTVLACLDIDVVMTIRTDETVIDDIQLTELASPLYITVTLPEGAPTEPEDPSKILQYYIVLEHEGSYYTIPATLNEDGTISFNSRLFSTYAIVYKMIDKPVPVTPAESTPSRGGYVVPKTGVER